ncbi:protein-L-isoaspartate O-methyltransferase family protein, partial [Maritalea sp.]|uniref:protein-L-isoaspartate O-methyltransferase family protein n=1 Tax=Maritalea sp. TaxID=2003361 RepID=UPI0039E53E6F
RATEIWKQFNLTNIIENNDDGLLGWSHQAPFPRILLTGSVKELPSALTEQLAEGGALVAAIGEPKSVQRITRIVKTEGQLDFTELGDIRLPALIQGKSTAP